MRLSKLGEFGLIDAFANLVEQGSKKGDSWGNLIIGIGDDAAAWRCQSGTQLATVDALVEDVHFKLGTISWEDLGWKSLAINVSDIAAMGGLPRYALVSLALPEQTEVDDILSFYHGMLEMAAQHEVAVVGGNVSRSPSVSINITVLGEEGPSGSLLRRSGAKVGDKIAVTGNLGGAAGGLRVALDGLKFGSAASLARSFARPTPRVKEGLILAESGVRAAIDLSDGLVSDLGHVCRASSVGARINVESVPLAEGLRENFPQQALEWGLSGGEDYELLFAAPARIVAALKAALDCPVSVVGQIVEDPNAKVTLLDRHGKEINLAKVGWDHFARENHGV